MNPAAVSREGTILRRAFRPEQGDLPIEAARWLLGVDLAQEDHQRVSVLMDKAREGTLSAAESAELEDYGNVGRLLELLKAKAQAALRRQGPAN